MIIDHTLGKQIKLNKGHILSKHYLNGFEKIYKNLSKIILIIILFNSQILYGQLQVTLDDCYNWGKENYPNLKQAEIYKEITALNKENIRTNYMPKVNLNAQATYQSDVPGIDIQLPSISIPSVSKDQYKAYAEFKQTIWDGGISAVNIKLENAILKSNLSQLEVEMYKLNEQISQAFFMALVLENQCKVLDAQSEVLEEKLKFIESGIKNGVLEKSNVLALKAELLTLEQNKVQLESGKSAALAMLNILTGKTITKNTELIHKNPVSLQHTGLNRPETELFSNQSGQLKTQLELLDKTRNPKIFGFGQAGYGKPGLNMLSDDFDSYYLVGVGISWNAFDWKNTFRKKQVLAFQQEMIRNQEATFNQNIEIMLANQTEEIKKFENMVRADKEMISLRTEISKVAASKLENEVITVSDYVREVQNETVSKLNLEIHKIKLSEAIEKHNLIIGK